MTRLTREQRDELVAAYCRGTQVASLSTRYGISYNTLYKVLHDRGIPLGRRPPQDEDRRQRMVDAYRRGDSLRTVGHMFGLSSSGVRQLLLKSGVTLRPRRMPQQGLVVPQHSADGSRRHPLSEIERSRILQLHDAGTPVAQIAVLCKVSSSSVYRVLQPAGAPRRPWRKISPGARQAIVASYQQGKTLQQVGEQFSVSAETIRTVLIDSGVQPRTSADYRKDPR